MKHSSKLYFAFVCGLASAGFLNLCVGNSIGFVMLMVAAVCFVLSPR